MIAAFEHAHRRHRPRIAARLGVWSLALVGAVLVVTSGMEDANAQQGIGSRITARGSTSEGLGSGPLRLHPGLFVEGGYDSNVFNEDDDELPATSTVTNLIAKLGASTPKANKVDFTAGAGVMYSEYFSDLAAVDAQSGFAIFGDAELVFNPNGAVAFALRDNFQRSNEAPNSENPLSFNRVFNQVGADLRIQPGGRVLTLDIGGAYNIFRHTAALDDLDRDRWDINAVGRWKFLPKTALTLKFSQQFNRYAQANREIAYDNSVSFIQDLIGGLNNVDSSPMRVTAGLTGLITNRVSLQLDAGYGNGFYDSGPNTSMFIGTLGLGYEISKVSKVRLGYNRDFRDSAFGNFAQFHRVVAAYNHFIGDIVELNASGAFIYDEYSTVPGPLLSEVIVNGQANQPAFSTNNRVDPIFQLNFGGMVHLFDIWRIGARYGLDLNDTDFQMITGIQADDPNPNNINTSGVAVARFVKHRFFLNTGVEW